MKKTTILLTALAFSGAALAGGPDPMAPPAPAPQNNMYVGFNVAMTDNFYQTTGSAATTGWYHEATGFNGFDQGGFQVGMRFGALRAEVQVNYGNMGPAASAANALTGWLRGMYDLQLAPGLSVYPVAQIGFVHSFSSGASPAATNPSYDSNTSFAWGLGAGVSEMINQSVSVYGEYTWVNSTRDAWAGATGIPSYRHTGANVFSVGFNHDF